MSLVYGIDLGTTYSCISYIDEYGKPMVLKNRDGEHTTPSVVFIESDNNIIVGSEAKRSVEIEPDKTVQFIKRKIGKESDKVMLNNTEYTASEISAYILKKLVNDANDELRQTGVLKDDELVKDVVITCPAYFGMNERQSTKLAGQLAGLNVLDIINEPTAAAINYGVASRDKDETVLVYDLGGGTFDITVMNIKSNNIKVVCTGGDDQLGGKDWDECLMNYIIGRYEEEYGEDLSEDPEIIASLYVDIETWKKALTTREKINISVNGPAGRLREELTRERYEELTKDLLNRTKNLLDDVLKTAETKGYSKDNIDKVLLVGGSSRMPQVAKMIEQDYNIKPSLSDPDEAVSKGAAIYAKNQKQFQIFIENEALNTGKTVEELKEANVIDGMLDKKFQMISDSQTKSQISIVNVLSRTYGIATYNENNNKKIFNMLKINSDLPATCTEQFSTMHDDQMGISLEIFETRSNEQQIDVENREPITIVDMKLKQSVPKGTPVIISLSLDNSGILHIQAEETMHHTHLETTFQLSNQMSDSELDKAEKRLSFTNVE